VENLPREGAKIRIPAIGAAYPGNSLREILRYNSMSKGVTPERNGEYFKGREMLLKNLTSYMVSYNHEPTTNPILKAC
jgi:hypothetical protein